MIRTYSDLMTYPSFDERYRYLRLGGAVGRDTFGFDRYLNQGFYRSREWKLARTHVIARDLGCDLAVEGHEIFDKVIVHHMNPMAVEDIVHGNEDVFDPEFLITVSHNTHNAIHYGDESKLPKPVLQRRPGDTTPWRSL